MTGATGYSTLQTARLLGLTSRQLKNALSARVLPPLPHQATQSFAVAWVSDAWLAQARDIMRGNPALVLGAAFGDRNRIIAPPFGEPDDIVIVPPADISGPKITPPADAPAPTGSNDGQVTEG